MLSAIFDPASYAFNAYAIPTLATAGAMLLFGVLVLVRERGSRVAVQLALLAGAISIWLTCFSIMYLSVRAEVALVWARSAYLGIGFIPAALYGFAVAVTGGRRRRRVWAGWLISAAFTLVMLTTGALVRDLYRYWWGYYPRFRWLGVPFLIFFFTMLALSLHEYWRDYRTASPQTHRRRSRLLMIGFAAAYLGSFDYIGAYGVPLYPFGYAPVLVFIAIVTYTLGRYRLVDLTPAFAAEQILATVADPVIVCDLAGKIRFTNEAASTVFGYAPGELAGALLERLAEPRVGSTVRLHLADREVVRDAEMVFRTRQGEAVEVEVSLSPLTDGQGQAVGAVLLARDIRARKRAEAALRKSEESYRTLFERNQAGVFRTLSAEGTILDCNDAFARILGYASRSECIGGSMAQYYADPGQRPRFLETLRAQGVLSDQEIAFRKHDGSPAWVLANVDLLAASDSAPEMLEGTVIDITQRRNAESQIVYQALHDSLTGLPNRTLFYDRLTQALAQGKRHDDSLAVLFLDLDQFKLVNDTLGHAAGDRLLIEVAGRLRQAVRASDTVARVGGDELAFLLPGVGRAEDAARTAQKVLEAVSRPLDIDGHPLYITASIGISLFPADGEEAAALLSSADIAMYRAKDLGRNGYQLSSPAMNAKSLARLTLERDLRTAIERGELSLVYQPQAGVANGKTVGFEALLRWSHPQRGLVLPGEFIAIAEETRLILPLGEWVLRTACEQARRWRTGGLRPRVAVNLSALQLSQRDLASAVQSTLSATGLDPDSLELEITESAAMLNAEQTIEVLSELREMGVRISIDDFGTGHASLAYLKQFPIDALKIDRSFVADMEASREGLAIITAITGLAHGLGLGVIAEGVESESQLRLLAACGCDEYQGYLLSRPLSPATVPGFLDRSKRSTAVPLS